MPEGRARRADRRALALGVAALALSLTACGGTGSAGRPAGTASARPATATAAGTTVNVLYAGSLVNMMEHDLGPAFAHASGDRFRGFAGGSDALAQQIKGRLRRADVFISASPSVNGLLTGRTNGDWVTWYATFAAAPLVIGYNAQSSFAAQLKTKPWYQVMAEPGFRLGRTDPKLDPKGRLTVTLVQRAGAYYHAGDLVSRILGGAANPNQVFPEADLLGRLQAGQLDAGFFYSNEAAEAHIPVIHLPAAIDPKATYTVTIVRGAPHPRAAQAFVAFLLGPRGQAVMQRHGLTTQRPAVSGDAAAVPASLAKLMGR